MESRFYWGIEPRQWPADVDGTPDVSRVERQDESKDCLSLFIGMFHVKHNVKFLNKKLKMKEELYIKKNGKDSFDLIKGSLCWEKVSVFQMHSWIADESIKVLPVGVKGKGKFKITIEQIE